MMKINSIYRLYLKYSSAHERNERKIKTGCDIKITQYS